MQVSGMSTAFCVCLSDTAGNGPTPAGIAGLRHKPRHKTTQGNGPPPVPSVRNAKPPLSPAREGGSRLARLSDSSPSD
jgi:hypothetical protein